MVFTRLQVLPRLYDAIRRRRTPDTSEGCPAASTRASSSSRRSAGSTRSRTPELAISLGKFDSVFGIEYLDNQANFRIGVTPSLIARYTTGQSIGAEGLLPRIRSSRPSSAISLNVAATNSGTFVEALQGPSRSLTGAPGRRRGASATS